MTRIPLSDFLGGGTAVAPAPTRLKLEDFLAGGSSPPAFPASGPPAAPSPPVDAQVGDFLDQYEPPGVSPPDMSAWMEDPQNNPPDPSWILPGEYSKGYGQQKPVQTAAPGIGDFLGGYNPDPAPLDNGDLTVGGQQLPNSALTPAAIENANPSERFRQRINKDLPFQYDINEWGQIGGAVENGQDELPAYDGSIPLATLMKPKANAEIAGIRQSRAMDDEAVWEQLYRGTDADLEANGASASFRRKLKSLNNYRAIKDTNPSANEKYQSLLAELSPKMREVWGNALDNQERFAHLKQAMREELDTTNGWAGDIRQQASSRVAGQAIMDTGTLAASAFYRATGREAKSDDLNLAKLAYDEVVNEYSGDSKAESIARGVGSSLFQGLLFGRLGAGVAGGGEKARQIGATVSTAAGFGAGARDQTYAQAGMSPITEGERRQVAGRQAAIEAGVMSGFALAAGAMGAQTLESILGGGQKIQNLKNTATTILSEMSEESATTALQDWNQKTGGLTPDDAPLMPQMVDTWIQTALTLGLAEGSTRVADFISQPTKEKAKDLGLDKVYSDDQLADVASSVAGAVYGPSEQGVDLTGFDPPQAPHPPADAIPPDAPIETPLPPEAIQEQPAPPAEPVAEPPRKRRIGERITAPPEVAEPTPAVDAPVQKKSIGERKPVVAEPTQTIAGKMTLDEFESKGYQPDEVTREDWVNMQRSMRRSLGQSEESGTKYAPFVDYEEFHKQSVEGALKRGEEVDDRVLADYPDLAKKYAPTPPVAPPDAPPVAPSQAPADSGVGPEVIAPTDATIPPSESPTLVAPAAKRRARPVSDSIPADIEVEIEAIKSKTGERIKVKQNAREAYAELNTDASQYKKLLHCLGK